MMEKEYFFTFGSNHIDNKGFSLGQRFVTIKAENENAARDTMSQARGQWWAFCYDNEGFFGQPEKYGLVEADISDVMLQDVYHGR